MTGGHTECLIRISIGCCSQDEVKVQQYISTPTDPGTVLLLSANWCPSGLWHQKLEHNTLSIIEIYGLLQIES